MYKLTKTSSIQRISDGAFIPVDPGNRDYAEYLEWRAAGNTPEPAMSLEEMQNEVWEKIKALRDSLSDTGGYMVVVGGVSKWFHSDQKSKTQQLALARKADKAKADNEDMSVPFTGNSGMWKTMDGSFVPMSPALAIEIADAAEVQEGELYVVAETHKAMMMADSDPLNYDYTTGWPAVFEE